MAKPFGGKRPQNLRHTLRRFMDYLGRHKIMLGVVGLLAAVSALAALLGTYMIRPIVNGVLENGSAAYLAGVVALTAGIYIIGALSTLGYTQLMVRAAQKILQDIRRDLFAHLQTLPLHYFDTNRKGDLMSLFTLLKHPKVLIFDDSTSAVDTATESDIRHALAGLGSVTKLIIAQRITSVQSADLIVILDDGRLHAVGTHDELLAKDTIYQEIYHSQMKGGDADGEAIRR